MNDPRQSRPEYTQVDTFRFEGQCIKTIYSLLGPQKLRRVSLPDVDPSS